MVNKNQSYHLASYGILQITGADRVRFLQGQLTCDMSKLAPHTCQLAAHLNPQGRIISLFYLLAASDCYYLVMPRELITIALSALKKYAVFYKLTLSDRSKEQSIIAVATENDKHDGYRLNILDITIQLTEKADTTDQTCAWQLLLIKHNIPTVYPQTSGLFLPHELNLPNLHAVSFDKGCYTGQEIVARMHYKGKSKKVLHQLPFPISIHPGQPIFAANKREAGTVIDASKTEQQTYMALLLLDNHDFIDQPLSLTNEL